jgi:hypothetical protein
MAVCRYWLAPPLEGLTLADSLAELRMMEAQRLAHKPNNWYCGRRACTGEQRYGHLYQIGSRGYEFIPAELPLSRSLQDALSEIRLCCRS